MTQSLYNTDKIYLNVVVKHIVGTTEKDTYNYVR